MQMIDINMILLYRKVIKEQLLTNILLGLARQQKIILEVENKSGAVIGAFIKILSNESNLLNAETEAASITKIDISIRENQEMDQYVQTDNYIENAAQIIPKSTVLLYKDVSEVSKLVATSTSINKSRCKLQLTFSEALNINRVHLTID